MANQQKNKTLPIKIWCSCSECSYRYPHPYIVFDQKGVIETWKNGVGGGRDTYDQLYTIIIVNFLFHLFLLICHPYTHLYHTVYISLKFIFHCCIDKNLLQYILTVTCNSIVVKWFTDTAIIDRKLTPVKSVFSTIAMHIINDFIFWPTGKALQYIGNCRHERVTVTKTNLPCVFAPLSSLPPFSS